MCHEVDNSESKSLIYTTELCEICTISTNLWDLLHKHKAGPSYKFSTLYCARFCMIQPGENGIIYSLSTSGMLAPQSLTTGGQFSLVPLTPSSETAVFKSTGMYKYIAHKRTALTSEVLINRDQHFYSQYVRVMYVYLTSVCSVHTVYPTSCCCKH